MRILAVTMGRYLQVFLRIHQHLKDLQAYSDPAVYVADSLNYRRAVCEFPELTGLNTLKEWELRSRAMTAAACMERLRTFQASVPISLWNAALADRRVFFGRLSKARQDYRPIYTERQLLALLDVFLLEIEEFVDSVQPDTILSFGTTTLGDYLFELIARRRAIPFWQVKATKIKNRVGLFETGIDISSHLASRVAGTPSYPQEVQLEAEAYMASVQTRGVTYEGAILFSKTRLLQRLLVAPRHLAAALRQTVQIAVDPVLRADMHLPPPFRTACLTHLVHPLRTFILGQRLPFVSMKQLLHVGDFVFYPMHFEPEVSLQVFGKPFQNQIELIRNIALSVPVGTRVLVKEHPRALGFRKASYYRKLLDIPNVRLVDPFVPTVEVVRRATLVATVSGSVSLEAVISRKPVLVFGKTPITLLPASMVLKVERLIDLDKDISAFLSSYHFDERAVLNYLCALLADSLPINLYTDLLGKAGRYSESRLAPDTNSAYRSFATFLHNRMLDREGAAARQKLELATL